MMTTMGGSKQNDNTASRPKVHSVDEYPGARGASLYTIDWSPEPGRGRYSGVPWPSPCPLEACTCTWPVPRSCGAAAGLIDKARGGQGGRGLAVVVDGTKMLPGEGSGTYICTSMLEQQINAGPGQRKRDEAAAPAATEHSGDMALAPDAPSDDHPCPLLATQIPSGFASGDQRSSRPPNLEEDARTCM